MLNRNLRTLTPARLALGALLVLSALLVPVVLAACDNGGGRGTSGTGVARSGEVVFQRYCNVCHPGGGLGAGPSLIRELPGLSDQQVRDVVRHGESRMPGFSDQDISEEELENLLVYIRSLK
ncbi:MAG: cytochrome c [Chloroflexota bacterium]|nr:cytochrome c [Chloroflexota bacterium]MDQ5866828.1 cytochrome c [Chloroflexota bacterium]